MTHILPVYSHCLESLNAIKREVHPGYLANLARTFAEQYLCLLNRIWKKHQNDGSVVIQEHESLNFNIDRLSECVNDERGEYLLLVPGLVTRLHEIRAIGNDASHDILNVKVKKHVILDLVYDISYSIFVNVHRYDIDSDEPMLQNLTTCGYEVIYRKQTLCLSFASVFYNTVNTKKRCYAILNNALFPLPPSTELPALNNIMGHIDSFVADNNFTKEDDEIEILAACLVSIIEQHRLTPPASHSQAFICENMSLGSPLVVDWDKRRVRNLNSFFDWQNLTDRLVGELMGFAKAILKVGGLLEEFPCIDWPWNYLLEEFHASADCEVGQILEVSERRTELQLA